MSHFENTELARSVEPNISENASNALFADSMPPFKVALRQEAKPILLASNDSNSGCSTSDSGSGCSTRDVPSPVEPHTPPVVEQPAPTQIEIKPVFSQQQGQEQGQDQSQNQAMDQAQGQKQAQQAEAEANAIAKLQNENKLSNTGNVNGTVENTVGNSLDSKNTNANANALDNKVTNTAGGAVVDASSANRNANNINVGGNSYKSYSNARGEALPGNDCQTFAVRLDGHFLGTGGAVGLSNSDNKCIEAKAVKVNCDATDTMSRANINNSHAEQSWLQFADKNQKAEIIDHGIKNAKHISDNVVAKSAECVQGEKQVAPPVPAQQAERREVSQGNYATKDEIQALEQRTNSKLNAVHRFNMQK
ncbi:hypothetical protein KA344_17705 [bacterium]|jgi:hypothetical protein|nr:hypothetical protein [bacterium]